MNRPHFGPRVLILALMLAAAIASSSCNEAGIGVGIPAGARWGGGASTGPGVFVGGPQ